MALGGAQHQPDRARQTLPRGLLALEVPPSRRREAVVAGAAIALRGAPLGADPALPLETRKRRVERALLDEQDLLRHLANALRDRPAVHRLESDRLQDQQVERALDQVGRLAHRTSPRLSTTL